MMDELISKVREVQATGAFRVLFSEKDDKAIHIEKLRIIDTDEHELITGFISDAKALGFIFPPKIMAYISIK